MPTLRKSLLSITVLTLFACEPKGDTVAPAESAADTGASEAPQAARIEYPSARRSDHVDDYHGEKVADPYRWMEDIDDPEVRTWIEAQNELTFGHLEEIEARPRIKAKLEALWNYERRSAPFEEGGKWFVYKNDGLQNHSVLYTMDSPKGEPRVLLDPNTLSEDGTVAVGSTSYSKDGKYLAYALSASGSDWRDWHVRDIETGQDLDDVIKWTKFIGASWAKDGSGFYYGGYEAPKEGEVYEGANYSQKLYFHRLGTPQSADRLVYERKDHEDWQFGGFLTDDGKYLIMDVSVGTDRRNRVFYQKMGKKKESGKTVELLNDFDAAYNFIDNDGSVFYFRTDLDAPRGRVIAIDIRKPERKNWKELIPESEHTLRGVSRVGDKLIANYMADASSRIKTFDMKGKFVSEVELPGIGSAGGFGGDREDTDTYYSFNSFTRPSSVYRYDLKTGKSELFWEPKLAFNPENFETKQVFYSSYDGTRVPMFIVHKKGLELTGDTPTYLYAYGGFNISLTPRFSVPDLVWMEMGGIYAQPNLRGGGEYGEAWHEAGTKTKKQNVFDDFAAAAEYLIKEGYTKSERLAIGGRSNGGLLMGASVTQRPDLWGAVLAGVGVMDMLRFHKFTIGWAWVSDYGSSDDKEQFAALRKFSPVHNVKAGAEYPPTLIYTADHDDRVVPSHSYKFAAEMQQAQAGTAPVMIRIDTKAGHGAGKPTSKRIEEWTDLWGFAVRHLGVELPEGF